MHHPYTKPRSTPPADTLQQGAVLIVSLLILLVMTIIGITSVQVTTLQEKMAGNLRDKSVAFQAAESALRAGENLLLPTKTPPIFNGGGYYRASETAFKKMMDGTWSWTDNTKVRTYTGLTGLAANPVYIIEEINPSLAGGGSSLGGGGGSSKVSYYRITARAVGANPNTVAMVQSIYKR